jgi:hypothetical protein
MLARACHWYLFWNRLRRSMLIFVHCFFEIHFNIITSSVISSSVWYFSNTIFQLKCCMNSSPMPSIQQFLSVPFSLILHPNNIPHLERIIWSSSLLNIFQPRAIYCFLGSNILLGTMFSNTSIYNVAVEGERIFQIHMKWIKIKWNATSELS